uniref:Transposase n=1 Tax=Haemonchus contortus TaxID=6289 RepID=A0A7I4YFL3_HAECO
MDLSRRVITCTSLLTLQKKRHFLNSLITGDENWVLYDNPVRKRQWVNKGEQPELVPKADLHPKKILLSCWWSRKGMEHWELLEKGQTINATMCVEQLQKLKAYIDRTRGKNAEVYFHNDNARPHTAKATQAELEKYDWVPSTAFPQRKKFETKDEVEKALDEFIKSQPPSFWEEGINKLPERWRRAVDGDGAYL